MLLRTLKQTWRKIFQRMPAQDSSRLHGFGRALSRDGSQKQPALAENARDAGDIDSVNSQEAELLNVLNERIVAMDAASRAASIQIEELRESIADAAARQEKTETQLRLLRERQEKERREHQAYVQEAMDRERRQNRRLGWSMVLACCALLLGTLAGTATFRDGRQYAGLLAELSRDIKNIKASIERQVAAQQTTASEVPAESIRETAESTATDHRDVVRQQPDIASAVSHFHPHNKYRNREEMLAFFRENASELGVVSVAEGLQYRVVDQGAGKSPGATDTVVLEYSTFLLDGTQLFNSYDEPLPVQFSVSQLVPGLREVVQRMEEGARWEVYVSPDHAYRGGVRKRRKYGYEPLVYVVELKSVIDTGGATL
jgi:FKBP-type peptidyl-prolyl cis-trans isomerase